MTKGDRDNERLAVLTADTAAEEDKETEIDLFELLYRILENIKYVILAAVLGTVVMGLYSFVIASPTYEATAKLYVLSSSDSAVNLADLQIGTYLTADYQEVFKTWEVHERVIRNLGLDYTYAQLTDMLTIANPSNTRILSITVNAPSAAEAAEIANEYAEVAREYIAEKMSTDMPNVLSVALPANRPVSPRKAMNLALGFLVGAIGAVAVIAVIFLLDDKIRSSDDIVKYTGMPTLAVVPMLNDENLLRMQKMNASAQRKGGGGNA